MTIFHRALLISLMLVAAVLGAGEAAKPFVHPGLLTSQDDIAFIRAKLKEKAQPWQSGWDLLAARRQFYLARVPKPAETYTDKPHWYEPGTARDFLEDGEAAYGNTLLWLFGDRERDRAHMRKAVEILNAWSSTLKKNVDLMLFTSYSFPTMMYAAELLRTQQAEWPKAEQDRFADMIRRFCLPHVDTRQIGNNWRSWGINAHIASAVYLDDRAEYAKAIARYRAHLAAYIREDGFNTELGSRDPDHGSMGAGPLAVVCEIAWKQGDDLFGLLDNRLAKSFELCAPVYLGDLKAIPGIRQKPWETAGKANKFRPKEFPAMADPTWPIFEIAHNHYVNRLGLKLPQLTAATEKMRPEHFWRMGWGTLLHAGDSRPGRAAK